MNAMRVDVLIPCAGDARYVEQTLRSVLDQDHEDWRALVIDNACDHGRYREFAATAADPRIAYVRFGQRLPITANWQRCLDLVQADHYGFLHDDDLWGRSYLSTALKIMAGDPAATAVLSAHYLFEGESLDISPFPPRPEQVKRWTMLQAMPPRYMGFLAGTLNMVHMSALLCQRKPFGFDANSLWNTDQRFILPHVVYGKLCFNPAGRAYVRWHARSGTLAFNNWGRAALEVEEGTRQALLAILDTRPPDDLAIEELSRLVDEPRYWFRLLQMCFSWPLRKRLVKLGRRLLACPAVRQQVRRHSRVGAALMNLPWLAWCAATMAADLDYFRHERQ